MDKVCISVLDSQLVLYERFIDDVFVIWKSQQDHVSSASDIQQILDGWCEEIVITKDDSESIHDVSFLDLRVRSSISGIEYSTFRKPCCRYMYTPWNSEHHRATKLGIIRTEIRRLLLTNLKVESFEEEKLFFAAKLKDRGYPLFEFRKIADQLKWESKESILQVKTENVKPVIVPLKLVFSEGLADLRSIGSFQRHLCWRPIMPKCVKIVLCSQVAPNLFRLRFNRFT